MLDLPPAALIPIAAGAMGVQSAVTLRLKAGFTTTYITGVLASLGNSLGSTMTPPSIDHPPGSARKAGLTWLAYFVGATMSGVIFLSAGPITLVLPIVCVGIFVYHHSRSRAAAV
jgi:uncharacterized membrane protein YoaK (UPF0700 family)